MLSKFATLALALLASIGVASAQQTSSPVFGPTFGSGGGGGGGSTASTTLENIYAAPGSFTFAHGLNSLFNQVHCVIRTGTSTYSPASWTDAPVDANDTAVTVPSAGDYVCSFNTSAAVTSDFSIATAPTSLLYEPTMTGTQQPAFTGVQTAIGGYSGTVTYSASGLASGMTGAFSPTTITGSGTNTLTLSFPASQTPATTAFTVSGTDGTKTHTASPSLTVGNINQGLVECWAMNDGSGTTFADSCGTSNTETLTTGTLTWASHSPVPGSTATFSATAYTTGTNQTATNFDGTQPFSMTGWVFLNGTVGVSRIFASTLNIPSNDIGWDFGIDGSGHLSVFLINNVGTSNYISVPSTTAITFGAWHFVSFTYDGSKTAAGVKEYLDGVLLTPGTVANSLTGTIANTKPASLGARTDGSLPLNGIMAYFRIYNRVLSQTDETNYNAAGAR